MTTYLRRYFYEVPTLHTFREAGESYDWPCARKVEDTCAKILALHNEGQGIGKFRRGTTLESIARELVARGWLAAGFQCRVALTHDGMAWVTRIVRFADHPEEMASWPNLTEGQIKGFIDPLPLVKRGLFKF